MPLRTARVWQTRTGEKVRLGFDDPLRWGSFLLQITVRKLIDALWSPPVLSGTMAAVLVLLSATIPVLDPASHSAQPSPPVQEIPVAKQGGALEQADVPAARLTDRVGPNEATLSAAVQRNGVVLSPPFEITDGRTFGNGELSVRLTEVESPDRDAVCIGDNGNPWACGLAARVALNNLIRVAPMTCDALVGATRPVDGQCRLANGNLLAAQLVAAGFARPAQSGSFAEELASAQKQRRGLWNGNWTYRPALQPTQ